MTGFLEDIKVVAKRSRLRWNGQVLRKAKVMKLEKYWKWAKVGMVRESREKHG